MKYIAVLSLLLGLHGSVFAESFKTYTIKDAKIGEFLQVDDFFHSLTQQHQIILTGLHGKDDVCLPRPEVLDHIVDRLSWSGWVKRLVMGWVDRVGAEKYHLNRLNHWQSKTSFRESYQAFYSGPFAVHPQRAYELHQQGVSFLFGNFDFFPWNKELTDLYGVTLDQLGYWSRYKPTRPLREKIFNNSYKRTEAVAKARMLDILSTIGADHIHKLTGAFSGSGHQVSSEDLSMMLNSQVEYDENLAWASKAFGSLVIVPAFNHARNDIGLVPHLKKFQPYAQRKVVFLTSKACSDMEVSGVDFVLAGLEPEEDF